MDWSRRQLLRTVPALAGGMLLPRLARAGGAERRFLFVFANGGWDTTRVFTPMIGNPAVVPEDGAVLAEEGGIPFVDHEERPSVRAFFEAHAHRACVINGLEVRSVAHELCRRIVLTGSTTGGDDWPALIAAASASPLLFPHLVLAGPAFTREHSGLVVRVGDNGQLPELLAGTAFDLSALPVSGPSPTAEALTDDFVRARIDARRATASPGRAQAFLERYAETLDQLATLGPDAEGLDLSSAVVGCRRSVPDDAGLVFDAFSAGLSRCAMIEDQGWCASSWDTHEGNFMQSWHFEELFAGLLGLLDQLDAAPGSGGGSLADETTVVVFSEMGRHPVENSRGGKEHWSYTSAMILGAGVQGGQVIGGLDEQGQGITVDLASGGASDAGTPLVGAHLGATLLALADIDPGEVLQDGVEPIDAALA